MARRSGLGKGLGALIPTAATGEAGSLLREVPIGSVSPNRHQPRTRFDEEALTGLVASIREVGVLQPILVRFLSPEEEGAAEAYELIAGERRWRAARRAGLSTIPALIRTADDAGALEQALVENLHREDLNALEEAAAYQQLIEDFGLTHDEVGRRVGKSRAAVSNALRLFQLPPTIQRLVAENELSAGHARALLGTPDRAYQEALARRAVTEGLSVRDVEEEVRARQLRTGSPEPGVANESDDGDVQTTKSPAAGGQRPPALLELEELLSGLLETRVKVAMGGKRGRVVIEFSGLEDLERIYRAMTATSSTSYSDE